MQNQVIQKKAKTVDEAVQAALRELGCTIENVTVRVIEEPTKALFGLIGGRPAWVEVTKKEQPQEVVLGIVREILKHMKINYEIDCVTYKDHAVRINFTGEDMGLLIGRKGETLNALQFLTGLIVNRRREEKLHVILDVEDYRLKREKALEELAHKLADKVRCTHKNIVMRPMTAQERRVVHTALQDEEGISTYSTGSEPNRKVIITYKKNQESRSGQE